MEGIRDRGAHVASLTERPLCEELSLICKRHVLVGFRVILTIGPLLEAGMTMLFYILCQLQ